MYLRCCLLNYSTINTKTNALKSSPYITKYILLSRTLSTTNEQDKVEKDKNALKQDETPTETDETTTTPKPEFLWRHSAEILPRIDSQSIEYNPYGPELWIPRTSWSKRMFIYVIAARSLGKSWFEIVTGAWEDELCENFTWAFGRSMSTLLGYIFHLPIDQLEKSSSQPDKDATNMIVVDFDSSTIKTTNSDDKNTVTTELAQKMLEQNVLQHYRNAVTDFNNIQIRLLTRPIAAKLININVIPYSRDALAQKPELKGLYCRLLASAETKNTTEFNKLRDTFFNAIGRKSAQQNIFKTAVISQVLIHCKEIFYVKDAVSGKVIQGEESDTEKDVYHLVRFEIPVFNQANILMPGVPTSWIVSDFDDLLNGNVYY